MPEGAVGKAGPHPAPAPELSTGYPQALGAHIARVQGTSVDISQHQALSYPQAHHRPPWSRLKCAEVRLSTIWPISYPQDSHRIHTGYPQAYVQDAHRLTTGNLRP